MNREDKITELIAEAEPANPRMGEANHIIMPIETADWLVRVARAARKHIEWMQGGTSQGWEGLEELRTLLSETPE
jgi:hypothetical protein